MPPWNDLSTSDLRSLVAYLKTLDPGEPPATLTGAELAMARQLYTKQCAVCHGPDGKGEGISALMLAPAPTNFHEVRPTTARAEAVLAQGVRGSAMPRWGGKLLPEEQKLLARYVRSFSDKD
jgi:mono/diheme cytochrome c family protein